jgi:hypothetical protein
MRTSLNDIKVIDDYLLDQLPVASRVAFEARLKHDAMLRLNVFLQQKVYALLKVYHRQKIKQKAEAVHDEIFQGSDHGAFRDSIHKIFKT